MTLLAGALAGCASLEDRGGPASCLPPSEHERVFEAARGFVNVSEHPDRVVTIDFSGAFEGREVSMTMIRDLPNRTFLVDGTVGADRVDVRARDRFWSVDDEVEEERGFGRDLDPEGAASNLAPRYKPGARHTPDSGPGFVGDLSASDYSASCGTRDGEEVVTFVHAEGGRRDELVAAREPPHRLLADRTADADTDHDLERTYRYESAEVSVDRSLPRVAFTVHFVELDSDRSADSISWTREPVGRTEWAAFGSTEAVTRDQSGVRDRAPLRNGTIELDGGTLTYEDRDGNEMISPGDVYRWETDRGVVGLFWDEWSGAFAREESA